MPLKAEFGKCPSVSWRGSRKSLVDRLVGMKAERFHLRRETSCNSSNPQWQDVPSRWPGLLSSSGEAQGKGMTK